MNAKILLLLVSSAVVALTSGVSVSPVKYRDVPAANKNGVAPAYFDGVDLNTLTDDELNSLMNAEDEMLIGYIDINAYTNGVAQKSRRPKRWIPLAARAAFVAGRALFRTLSRSRVTRSGSRLTRQYNKPGNYGDAVRDFRSLNPSGVKSISNNKLQGLTGTLGKHRVTVRNTSSNGRPTLEIRSPKPNGASTVRKLRYNRN